MRSITPSIVGLTLAVNLTALQLYGQDEGTLMSNAWAVLHGMLQPYPYIYEQPPLGWIQIAAWVQLSGGLFTFGNAINECGTPIGVTSTSRGSRQSGSVSSAQNWRQIRTGSGSHASSVTWVAARAASTGRSGLESRLWRHRRHLKRRLVDDYSYIGSDTSFTLSSRVTLYYRGTLVWGSEPL